MTAIVEVNWAEIAAELGLRVEQVRETVRLLDDGNTVPFITRYRKESTGRLDEEPIREIQKKTALARQVKERAETILRLLEAQKQLTDKIAAEIKAAKTLKRLEDLYLPFRPKRTSRANQARQWGLEPLANEIWSARSGVDATACPSLSELVSPLIGTVEELSDEAAVLRGVHDILTERIAEDAEVRDRCRTILQQAGQLKTSAVAKAEKSAPEVQREFRDYFDFSESLADVPPHRVLAINRGENLGVLRVKLTWDSRLAEQVTEAYLRLREHRYDTFLTDCVADAVSRLIGPSLEREARRELTDAAEAHAVGVFAQNLRELLLQPPLKGERVLAIDPGFRTGCKLAALDETGQPQAFGVISIIGSEEKRTKSRNDLVTMIREHQCRVIAIGNGTACRETEELVSAVIAEECPESRYLIVNEAGASVYSASPVAREELSGLEATERGTVSIGRRLLDPLSELVKIDPQHLGVGLYQHDIKAKRLSEALEEVVESCVNFVGVDLNTASISLLKRVSGFNQLIARRVVDWRNEHGRFRNRSQLMSVAGIGEAVFTQAAGFLKINDGDEPLDRTWIHPESYAVAHGLLNKFEIEDAAIGRDPQRFKWLRNQLRMGRGPQPSDIPAASAAQLHDIADALCRPGRDPRTDRPGPIFRKGIVKFEDLAIGMQLDGTVLNVVDFGAFVDVGLKNSALVHVSKMAGRFIRHPHEVVSVGDVVTVWVLDIDLERKRVGLTMIPPDQA